MEEKKTSLVENITLTSVPADQRKPWPSIAFIWAGSVICVPALMVGSLISAGMNFKQSALCMVIGGVGWAKPVGINPRNFKNPKHGMAISAAAGPISNLLLAYVCTVLYKTLVYATWGRLPELLAAFLWYMISMNISLAVFNLIPVPPFDGSRIVLLFLPEKYYFRIMRYERYIMAAVLALVLFGALDRPLSFLVNLVWGAMNGLTGFVELAFGF